MESSENNFSSEASEIKYPPKPELKVRDGNSVLRSLIGLLAYAVLFYFIFDSNLSYIAGILLIILIHEAGHFLMMKFFDYSQVRIFILPLIGAFTNGKKQNVSQRELIYIILAGPVPGIIIGCVMMYFSKSTPGEQNEIIKMLYQTFLIINVLNCLPFHPLDGGRLMETIFFKENHAIRIAFGIISIVALVALCIILMSPFLIIIPIFISLELFHEIKIQKIRNYLDFEKINYHIDYENLSNKAYWLIRDCLIFSYPRRYSMLVPGKHEHDFIEPVLVQNIQSVLQVNLQSDMKISSKIITIIFYTLLFVVPIWIYYL